MRYVRGVFLVLILSLVGFAGFSSPHVAAAQDDSQPPSFALDCPTMAVFVNIDEPMKLGSFANCQPPLLDIEGVATTVAGLMIFCGDGVFTVDAIQSGNFDGRVFLQLDNIVCSEATGAVYATRRCPGLTGGVLDVTFPVQYQVRYRCNDQRSTRTAVAVLEDQNGSTVTGIAVVTDNEDGPSTISISTSVTDRQLVAFLYTGTCEVFDSMSDQVGGLGVLPFTDAEFLYTTKEVQGDIIVVRDDSGEIVSCGEFPR